MSEPNPSPACEQDGVTIAYLHDRIDRLEKRDADLADMTRQRDEAVKAFQRERAKVVRAGDLVVHVRLEGYGLRHDAPESSARLYTIADALDAALSAPHAPQAPVDASEVAGEGSDGQRAGERP